MMICRITRARARSSLCHRRLCQRNACLPPSFSRRVASRRVLTTTSTRADAKSSDARSSYIPSSSRRRQQDTPSEDNHTKQAQTHQLTHKQQDTQRHRERVERSNTTKTKKRKSTKHIPRRRSFYDRSTARSPWPKFLKINTKRSCQKSQAGGRHGGARPKKSSPRRGIPFEPSPRTSVSPNPREFL